jgi:hypothetical protein
VLAEPNQFFVIVQPVVEWNIFTGKRHCAVRCIKSLYSCSFMCKGLMMIWVPIRAVSFAAS